MKSIRTRLIVWLLVWLSLLWIVAGAVIYYSVRKSLYADFDEGLRGLLAGNRQNAIFRPGSEQSYLFDEGGDYFFQIWTGKGVRKSKSLGENSLKPPSEEINKPAFTNHLLEDGRKVRVMSLPPRGGPKIDPGGGMRDERDRAGRFLLKSNFMIAVGKDRNSLESSLAYVFTGIIGVGVLALLITTGIVHFVLSYGLKPLTSLSRRMEGITEDKLETRFEMDGLPSEISPITERFNGLLERLEKSFQRERRFGADLAHELRTPISEMKSLAEVGIKWPQHRAEGDYQTVLASAQRMEAITQSLLTLSRLEAGAIHAAAEEVCVKDLINTELSGRQAELDRNELLLDLNLLSEGRIHSEPDMLRIVMKNLIENAIHYAPKGSRISISSNAGDPSEIFSIANAVDHFSEADLEKLFERFWRKEESRTDYSHSGLGLTLAKSCAEKLNLDLSARLEEGKILRFILRKN
ncbi:MAG: hypothetical protein HC845_02170 [Akkermansiaceae bacterium]|nr:hypothetical protein [Akkermansiaceae bacterium]